MFEHICFDLAFPQRLTLESGLQDFAEKENEDAATLLEALKKGQRSGWVVGVRVVFSK